MYKTIVYFEDLQDNNYPYAEGDVFPRDGLEVSESRLEELSGHANRRGIPLIKLVNEESENDKIEAIQANKNEPSEGELKETPVKKKKSSAKEARE